MLLGVTRETSTLWQCASRGLCCHNNFQTNRPHTTSDLRCKCPGPSARNYFTTPSFHIIWYVVSERPGNICGNTSNKFYTVRLWNTLL